MDSMTTPSESSGQDAKLDVMAEIPTSTSSTGGAGGSGRIGRYQIIKTLGEGSFGKVKLAYHMATHARVALKIINRKTLAKSDMQGRVEREISYLRLLRHPHIIKLYDVIKSKEEIIMVIEFAGKELFDYILQKGKMSEKEARRFFQQIISAVEYCHRHKIVHRDLKPENLLLDDNLDVKIADFGLSNIMTDGNFLKTSCGSPNYAAPEVISGKLYAGPEVDVWSCGVILYVMLCGRLPFDDEFIPALFMKISSGEYVIPSGLSPGARNLLQRMLVVNPLNRITVNEIMQDAWFKKDMPEYLIPKIEDEVSTENNSANNSGTGSANQSPNPEHGRHEVKLDEQIVKSLTMTMGYDREQVLEAFRAWQDTGEGSDIRDAYQVLKDNKSLSKDSHFQKDDIDKFLAEESEKSRIGQEERVGMGTPSLSTVNQSLEFPKKPFNRHNKPSLHGDMIMSNPSLTFDRLGTLDAGTPNNTIAILPTSLPAYHRANMMAKLKAQEEKEGTTKKLTPMSNKKSKTRWHFGIRSRSYPLDVMGEIYRALKSLGAEWAVNTGEEDLWTIYVRWRPPSEDNSSNQAMKMQIQLYQLEPNNYLVDFKFDGWEEGANHDTYSAYPFLHLATKLIVELAVNSGGA